MLNHLIEVKIQEIKTNNLEKKKNQIHCIINKNGANLEIINQFVLNYEQIHYIYSLTILADPQQRYIGSSPVCIPYLEG